MTHKHKLEEFTPWRAESRNLHEVYYNHGNPPDGAPKAAISVAHHPRSLDAILLERALFLNGYTQLLTAPSEDAENKAPRADDGDTWLDIPQVSLVDIKVTLPDRSRADDNKDWPATAERIEIDTLWNLNGSSTPKTLTTDLAFVPARGSKPRHAQPFLTADSRLTSTNLERIILFAFSTDEHEPGSAELAENQATAEAIADITLHGTDGWLTTIDRLVRNRVLPCLPAKATPPCGIRILLHYEPTDEWTVPFKVQPYDPTDPLRQPIETDSGPARERANHLRYERGPFDGHRGILLGAAVAPHSKLWQTLVGMHDAKRGETLWEPQNPIHGRTIELDETLRGMARDEGHEDAQHGVVWILETHRLPNKTRLSYMATTGGDPEQPGPMTVHVLSAPEHDQLRKRVLGPLLQAVVDHEKKRGEHAADGDHPVRELLAECEARRETSLAGR